MADQADVRRIALSLPGVTEGTDRFGFSVLNNGKAKGIAWVWLERVDPAKARVPNPEVLAVRVRDQAEKAMLLAADPERFFTEPHYNGYPAVLVRLRKVTRAQLERLLLEAWRTQAPRALTEAGRERGRAAKTASRPAAAARTDRSRRGRRKT
jgi:hypothetical protein